MTSSTATPLNEFAGFRGNRVRVAQVGRLSVPPSAAPEFDVVSTKHVVTAPSLSAADKVRERLLARKAGCSAQVGARTPGIASGVTKSIVKTVASVSTSHEVKPSAHQTENSGGEVLLFKCTGLGCNHIWVSGRGSTSFEQICKCCGASIVGVLTKGGIQCEISKEAKDDIGEMIRIEFQRPLGPGYPAHELEARLHDFVEAEIRFVSKFFNEEGIEDYVAYRRGGGGKEEEQERDMKKDVVMIHQMASIIEALCKAEFQGIMRGGEADAKLQGLLNGQICFRFVSPPDRSKLGVGGATINLAVDFAIARDVPDRVADTVDERLQKLRGVMKEMDKSLLAKIGKGKDSSDHPRAMLAGLISGLDWQKALSKISGREGHDQVRCMTCRFIGEDCSGDVQRSQDVRRGLRETPGFIFQAKMVLSREDRGGKSWQDRVSGLLAGIAGTRGGECFILASSDTKDRLQLLLYSQPEWLASAVQRITTYSQSGSSTPFFTDLLGLGRCAKGLQVIEPPVGSPPKYEVVSDVLSFLDLFADAGSCGGADSGVLSKRVRWNCAPPRCVQTQVRDYERARMLFRVYASFDEMKDFFDFLQDFRHRGAARAKPEPRPPRSASIVSPMSETLSQARSSSRQTFRAPPSPSQEHSKKRKRGESVQTRRSPSYRRSASSSPSALPPRARRSPSYRRER